MSLEAAEIVFYSVTAVMAVVWIVGVRFAFSRLRGERPAEAAGWTGEDSNVNENALTGEAVVEGDQEALSKKIAELLTTQLFPSAGIVKITERTPDRVSVEVSSPGAGKRGLLFRTATLTLHPEGSRVRVRYRVPIGGRKSALRAMAWLLGFLYGGLFVVGAPVLIWFLVLRSDDENTRGQVFQIFQMVHGVWPPYLVGFLCSRMRKAVSTSFDTLLANLQHML